MSVLLLHLLFSLSLSTHMTHSADVTIGFSDSSYTVAEGDGFADVVVEVKNVNVLRRSVEVTLSLSNQSALREWDCRAIFRVSASLFEFVQEICMSKCNVNETSHCILQSLHSSSWRRLC